MIFLPKIHIPALTTIWLLPASSLARSIEPIVPSVASTS
jgi:hypothetical protein